VGPETCLCIQMLQYAPLHACPLSTSHAPDGHPNSPTFGHLKLPHLN
jgi:hypothetical protein